MSGVAGTVKGNKLTKIEALKKRVGFLELRVMRLEGVITHPLIQVSYKDGAKVKHVVWERFGNPLGKKKR